MERLGFALGLEFRQGLGRSGVRANAWVMVQVWVRAQAGVRDQGGVGVRADDRV